MSYSRHLQARISYEMVIVARILGRVDRVQSIVFENVRVTQGSTIALECRMCGVWMEGTEALTRVVMPHVGLFLFFQRGQTINVGGSRCVSITVWGAKRLAGDSPVTCASRQLWLWCAFGVPLHDNHLTNVLDASDVGAL